MPPTTNAEASGQRVEIHHLSRTWRQPTTRCWESNWELQGDCYHGQGCPKGAYYIHCHSLAGHDPLLQEPDWKSFCLLTTSKVTLQGRWSRALQGSWHYLWVSACQLHWQDAAAWCGRLQPPKERLEGGSCTSTSIKTPSQRSCRRESSRPWLKELLESLDTQRLW